MFFPTLFRLKLGFHTLMISTLSVAALGAAETNAHRRLLWSDEFDLPNGASPDTNKWVFDLGAGGWGNNELQNYTSRTNNVRIEDGKLVIEARREAFDGSPFTSARLKTKGKGAWCHGRIEARMKIPRTQGIWPAFWMLGAGFPETSWPACGEIDIMENIGGDPQTVHGTIHGPGYAGNGGISGSLKLTGTNAFADDFRVYAVEWTTNRIEWSVDGKSFFSVTPAQLPKGTTWVYNQPHFILLNVAVGGNWPGKPDATTELPQRLVVDYVRVYAPVDAP